MVVEARDEIEQRRLAGAGRADEGHAAPGRYHEIDVGESRLPVGVDEADALEADFAGVEPQRRGAGPVLDVRLDVQHREYSLRRGEPFLERRVQIGEALHRLIRHHQRGDEGKDGSRRRLAGDDPASAVVDDRGDRDPAQRLHEGRGRRPRLHDLVDRPQPGLDGVPRPPRFVRLHAVGLDVPCRLQRLGQDRREPAGPLLGLGRGLARPPAEVADRQYGDGKDDAGDGGETPVLVKHQGDQEGEHQRILGDPGKGPGHRVAQEIGVVEETRDQPPRRRLLEVVEIGAHQMAEELDLNVGDDPLAHGRHDVALQIPGGALDQGDGENGERHHYEHGFVPLEEDLVQEGFHQPRVGRGRRGDDGHAQRRETQLAEVAADVVAIQPGNERVAGRRSRLAGRAFGARAGQMPVSSFPGPM